MRAGRRQESAGPRLGFDGGHASGFHFRKKERGFSLRPSTSGVAAATPNGVEFTVTFFSTADEAKAAAAKASGSIAYQDAVVTPAGKQLSRADLQTVEECIRGDDGS